MATATQKKASESDISVLNKKIESLRNQRISSNAKMEILKKNLSADLKAYKEQYGVNLKGKTLNVTKKLVSEELSKVQDEVQQEYELKARVVQLIEEGNISEANTLLGIKSEEPEEKPEEAISEAPKASTPKKNLDVAKSPTRKPAQEPSQDTKALQGIKGMEMYSMSDAFSEFDGDDLKLDDTDDLESEEDIEKDTPESGKTVDVDDEDEGLVLEDDLEDEEEPDFGFGDILKGSKFQF